MQYNLNSVKILKYGGCYQCMRGNLNGVKIQEYDGNHQLIKTAVSPVYLSVKWAEEADS